MFSGQVTYVLWLHEKAFLDIHVERVNIRDSFVLSRVNIEYIESDELSDKRAGGSAPGFYKTSSLEKYQ